MSSKCLERPPKGANSRPLFSTKFHRESRRGPGACQAENELAVGFRLWMTGRGGARGGGRPGEGRGQRPLDIERDVVEEPLGLAEERGARLRRPPPEAM